MSHTNTRRRLSTGTLLVMAGVAALLASLSVAISVGAVQVPQVPIVSGGVAPAIDPATGLPMPAGAAPAGGGPAAGGIPGRLFDTNELATQQTKREVERLFGRPLRMAGVTLVDAAQTNLPELSLEILISERDLRVLGLNIVCKSISGIISDFYCIFLCIKWYYR